MDDKDNDNEDANDDGGIDEKFGDDVGTNDGGDDETCGDIDNNDSGC